MEARASFKLDEIIRKLFQSWHLFPRLSFMVQLSIFLLIDRAIDLVRLIETVHI